MIAVDVFLLPHQSALLRQVDLALAEVATTNSCRGILLIGPSGSGKTFLLDLLEQRMPSARESGQRKVPVCVVSLSTTSDPASIMRRILSVLGKPESVTAGLKVADLEWQVLDAMDTCGVVVLVLEEFHNALLKTDAKLRGQANRFLKNLWNADRRGKRVILISGTDEIVPVFDGDDELNSRFGCRVYATSLWFDARGRSPHFRGIAVAIAKRHGVLHLVGTEDMLMLSRLLCACRGHLRRLDELCARVATLLREQPALADVDNIWALAYSQVLAKSSEADNPFTLPEEDLRRQIFAERRAATS
jgi:hypothetical protein